jgi:hypothetical protein
MGSSAADASLFGSSDTCRLGEGLRGGDGSPSLSCKDLEFAIGGAAAAGVEVEFARLAEDAVTSLRFLEDAAAAAAAAAVEAVEAEAGLEEDLSNSCIRTITLLNLLFLQNFGNFSRSPAFPRNVT